MNLIENSFLNAPYRGDYFQTHDVAGQTVTHPLRYKP